MTSNDPPKRRSLRNVIRNFPPAWFAATMGTGAIANLFYVFPYGQGTLPMHIFALAFFFLNLVLFITFTGVTIARHIVNPDIWRIMIHHPVQSLYLGTFPMGLTTMLNTGVNLINQDFQVGGRPFLYTLWSIWWIDVAMSVLCFWGMVHFMEVNQKHALEKMTAVWLLPVVTVIVASSSGGTLALAPTMDPKLALITATSSAFMVTIGITLACMMLTLYLLRLIVHGLPEGATIISTFLPLGPTGQAGFSILLLGRYYKDALPLLSSRSDFLRLASSGETIYVLCVCVSFALWALASMWVVFALLGVQSVLRKGRFPFRVGVWGLIFPNAVYANLTIQLGETFDSSFFRRFGAGYAVATLVMWIFVAYWTVVHVYDGQIFEAPCLKELNMGIAPEPQQCARGAITTKKEGDEPCSGASR